MSVGELLGRIIPLLDRADVKHMIAGSFASTYHGEPRTTQDIDIVIDGSRSAIEDFVCSLDPDCYYCDLDTARDAHARHGQFNLVDMRSGWKIDFILRKKRAFSITEFDRRITANLLGCDVFVATAEDTIIAKLDWAKETGSERQYRDVASIFAICGKGLDRDYIDHWIAELGLQEGWQKVLES